MTYQESTTYHSPLATRHSPLVTSSPEETRAVGQALGEACVGGEVILLVGDLGAGKTTLTQGIASGLGVVDPVVSPTFVLQRVYEGRLPLFHFDFYRLAGTGRAVDVEFEDYLDAGGVCVIEWPTSAPELIPPGHLRVEMRITSEAGRQLLLEASDSRHRALCERIGLLLS